MIPDSSLAFPTGRRSRRRTKPKLSLIAFTLRHEWFALPTQAIYRVVPLESIYGTNPRTGVSLTRYQDRDISVIDIERRVFTTPAQIALLPTHAASTEEPIQRYLMLIEPSPGDPIGILLNAQPHLYRVDETAFAPLPIAYQTGGSLRFVSALVSPDQERPSMFLLNLSQLLQPSSPTSLPGRSP